MTQYNTLNVKLSNSQLNSSQHTTSGGRPLIVLVWSRHLGP